jgi:hypothetical protein
MTLAGVARMTENDEIIALMPDHFGRLSLRRHFYFHRLRNNKMIWNANG